MYVGFVLPCIALGTGKKIRNYLASVLVIFVDICTPQIENLSALWSTVLVNAAEERKGLETVFTTAVLRRPAAGQASSHTCAGGFSPRREAWACLMCPFPRKDVLINLAFCF